MPVPDWVLAFLIGLAVGIGLMSIAFQFAAYKDFLDHLDAEHRSTEQR